MMGEALAFNNFGHQAIAALADKYMTDNAKKEAKAILKSDMVKASTWLNTLRKKSEMAHTKDWHYTTLDANGKSTTTAANDGVVELEKAIRLEDFIVMGELIAHDALTRNESCGGHFREEYQTEEGEAKRDDENFFYVGCWEYQGDDTKEPVLHKEPLVYEAIKVQTRNYKN